MHIFIEVALLAASVIAGLVFFAKSRSITKDGVRVRSRSALALVAWVPVWIGTYVVWHPLTSWFSNPEKGDYNNDGNHWWTDPWADSPYLFVLWFWILLILGVIVKIISTRTVGNRKTTNVVRVIGAVLLATAIIAADWTDLTHHNKKEASPPATGLPLAGSSQAASSSAPPSAGASSSSSAASSAPPSAPASASSSAQPTSSAPAVVPASDGEAEVVEKDGTKRSLPLVGDDGKVIKGDSTRDPRTPPTVAQAKVKVESWKELVDLMGNQQWYIDGINARKSKTGFGWSDIQKWATTPDDSRVIQVFNLKESEVSDKEAKDAARKLIGKDADGLRIARHFTCIANTRGFGHEKMQDFADCRKMVRVSLSPINYDKNGKAVSLNSDEGVFVDCLNLWWIPPKVTPPTKPTPPKKPPVKAKPPTKEKPQPTPTATKPPPAKPTKAPTPTATPTKETPKPSASPTPTATPTKETPKPSASPTPTATPTPTPSKQPLPESCQQNNVNCPPGVVIDVVQPVQSNSSGAIADTSGAPKSEPPPSARPTTEPTHGGSGDGGAPTPNPSVPVDNSDASQTTSPSASPSCPFGPGNC